MEFTGFDTVVFTFEPPRLVFARLLAEVLTRWPKATVSDISINNHSGFDKEPGGGLTAERLPTESWSLLFERDEAMQRHMDDLAYVPMADGEGPFAVWTRLRRRVEFRCERLDELQVIDDPPTIVGGPPPYQAWLCSPLLYEITAVTPGDPREQPFSAWVVEAIKRGCVGVAGVDGPPQLWGIGPTRSPDDDHGCDVPGLPSTVNPGHPGPDHSI